MMLSPLLRCGGAIAALFVLSVGDAVVEGKVASSRSLQATKAFMKAMKPVPNTLRRNTQARKQKILKKMLSKAKPSGRRLDQQDGVMEQFGFDVTQYSIKYSGCSSVMTYSDELAEEEDVDTVLENKRFVIFRLCPSKYCNKYSVSGCSYDYGEYLIEMGDYLEAYSEYAEQKSEEWCEYCRPCIEADEEAAEAEAQGDDARRLEEAQEEEDEQCDEDICQDYSMCVEEDMADDDAVRQQQEQENIDIREFIECMAVEYGDDDNNDLQYFIGPHCNSDGYTVSIGVYSDENCNTWIGDEMSIEDVMGFEPDFSELSEYFPKECLSCLEYEEDWQKEDQEDENGNNNNNNNEQEEDQVLELCERLFEQSAKCHVNYENVDDEAYQSDNQEANEDITCSYIESLQSGIYSEEGEITIDAQSSFFNFSNWNHQEEYYKQYQHVRDVVQTWQLLAIIAAVLGCLIMWIWACCLHSALRSRNIPWRPRRGKDTDPADISRQNSGIVMGRSQSGPNSTPLI